MKDHIKHAQLAQAESDNQPSIFLFLGKIDGDEKQENSRDTSQISESDTRQKKRKK